MPDLSKISAIICTYNRQKYLYQVLESIKNQSLNPQLYEIVIVNNNSTDNTELICQAFKKDNPGLNFIYVTESEQGLSAARNRGIKEASGKYLTFIDDDAFPEKNFLKMVFDYMEQNPEVIAVGGKILLQYEQEKPTWLTPYLSSLFGYFNPGNKPGEFPKNRYPRGSNMSFRKVIFDQVGVFDTKLGRKGSDMQGSEEKELFARINKMNFKVCYLPTAIVYHIVPPERTTMGFVRNQAISYGRSEKYYRQQHRQLFRMYFQEIFKWIASAALGFFYSILFQPRKGMMLLRFRYWVNKGMLMHH
jgi:glycosyltransferase involved in cell wall biosynthesis